MKRNINFLVLAVILIAFLLLLFKDPFSQRTLIPNFEPFPDTLFYVNPARSFVEGNGFYLTREGRKIIPTVAPLYSFTLIPFYIVDNDARMFYFANISLALISLLLLFLIIKKITKNFLVTVFAIFLYITNYFIYWQPTLAMAENLLLTVFLGLTLIIISSAKPLNFFLGGIIVVCFYATKYASIPLTSTAMLFLVLKALLTDRNKKLVTKNVVYLIVGFLSFFLIYLFFEASRGNNFLFNIISELLQNFSPKEASLVNATSNTETKSSWFSLQYIYINLPHYLNAITGGPERFLWDTTPLIPKFVGVIGLVGLVWGLFVKEFRLLTGMLLTALFSSILFISAFYSVDMRYIYPSIPVLIIGFAIFFDLSFRKFKEKHWQKGLLAIILLLFLFYVVTNVGRLKSQIMLNLKYAETPWYYVSVLELNKYFTPEKILNGKRPIVISPMVPYLIDFFSNGNYALLPLDKDQEFRQRWEPVWGPNDYADLSVLYDKYLQEGFSVYVARYGLGNEGFLNSAFQNLENKFILEKVSSGCYEQCNIYQLKQKKNE